MTAERVAIIGSRTYPSPDDVIAYVAALHPGTVIVSGGATGADTFAEEAAKRAGLDLTRHLPDVPKYGSPAAYFHRNKAIVDDCDRVVAFAAKDKRTKQITAGTQMTIDIARREGVPVEVIETPVPARVCDLIARLRHRYDGIRSAPTPSHGAYRIRSARELVADLVVVRADYDQRLCDGWEEIEQEQDADEADRKTATWLKWLKTYETVSDVITEARTILDSLSVPDYPLHRKSLHRAPASEVALACP